MDAQREKQSLNSGYLFALAATAIWSGNFIVARGLSESIPPVSLNFWRWTVAVIVSLPFAVKPILREWEHVKKHIGYLTIMAFLSVTIFNTIIYHAGHTATAINLSLISITSPIFIIIFSRFLFGELITLNKSVGIVLVVIGVILLITGGNPAELLNLSFAIGDVWMLLTAIIFASYSILLRQKPKRLSVWVLQSSTFILGYLMLVPAYAWERLTSPKIDLDSNAILALLYVGVFASVVAFVLWDKAVSSIGPTKAGMIYYTLPLFSGILAILFLGEMVTSNHFYSAVLIVSGILISNAKSKKDSRH